MPVKDKSKMEIPMVNISGLCTSNGYDPSVLYPAFAKLFIENNREELEEYEKKCIEKIKIKKSKNMDEDKINQYLYRKGFNISKYNN